ncbi:hypothetical protein AnigIFM56816_009292 [Aspergillus niger]|nr:hypothetical protein AnigIFM56816_009292 [Aspergillus niger]
MKIFILLAIWLLASSGYATSFVDNMAEVYHEITDVLRGPHHAAHFAKLNGGKPKPDKPKGVGKTLDDVVTLTVCKTDVSLAPTVETFSLPTIVTATALAPTVVVTGVVPTEISIGLPTEFAPEIQTGVLTGESHSTDTTVVPTNSVVSGLSSFLTGSQTVSEITVPTKNHTVSTEINASAVTSTSAHTTFPTANAGNDHEGMASSAVALLVALIFSLVRI